MLQWTHVATYWTQSGSHQHVQYPVLILECFSLKAATDCKSHELNATRSGQISNRVLQQMHEEPLKISQSSYTNQWTRTSQTIRAMARNHLKNKTITEQDKELEVATKAIKVWDGVDSEDEKCANKCSSNWKRRRQTSEASQLPKQ